VDTVSYSTAIVTMDLSCIVNEIQRDIGQDRDFSYLLAFDASVRGSPSECSHTVWCGKTRMAWPPDGGKGMSRPVARDLGSLKTPNSKMSTNFIVRLHTWFRASMGQDRLSWQCCMFTTCTKLTYLKLLTSSLRNIQDACSWTVCCSTNSDILGLSKY